MWTSTCRGVPFMLALGLALACAPGSARVGAVAAPDDTDASGPSARWSYEIRVDEALEHLQLGLCIEGPAPARLRTSSDAIAYVESARVRGGKALTREGQQFVVETLGEHGCLDLEIDLDAAIRASGRDSSRHADSIMVAPDRWLWYPTLVPADIEARARFVLPEGVTATVPWPAIQDDARADWRRLDHSAFGWNAWVAFGHYRPIEFSVAQCEFEVAVLDGPRASSDAGIEAWLRAAALSSAELHGRFPRERVSIVVIPTAGWRDAPVLFGMARRGGGASAMLILNSEATDEALVGEWVATHELLHLGMPMVADPWMSEGFVTYYTEILRARQGLLGGQDVDDRDDQHDQHDQQIRLALTELSRGFRRARGGVRTLASASDNMRSTGGYTRVYWGGAAIAFDLDLSIRVASGGRRSLDDLISMLQPLALTHRRWQAEELVVMMDAEVARWRAAGELPGEQSAQTEISLSQIIARHLDAKAMPAEIERLDRLAVEIQSSHIRLLAHPIDDARLRSELFEPKKRPQ